MAQTELKRIGGSFPPEALPAQDNGFLPSLAGPGDELVHMMSGRCGIMLAIEDWTLTDKKRVAYLPAYTCETVSGCFVKLGYQVLYYDQDRALRPWYDEGLLDQISLLLVCGYYGFPTFEEDYASRCRDRGIGVICDATHSVFTCGGIAESAHYVAASFRKWLPVPCGGIAIKRGGRFAVRPEPAHEEHLRLRRRLFTVLEEESGKDDPASQQKTGDAFWDAELLLREVYGIQESDTDSALVASRYPVENLRQKRMQNYRALLEAFPENPLSRPVFETLPPGVCPSHFCVYTDRRDMLQQALRERGIASTVYWPVPPFIDITRYQGAQWIYDHILSLPCDQRYGTEDMERIAQALKEAGELV